MSLKNIVISTLAGIGLAGTLACGDDVTENHYHENGDNGNGGSSSGACGNSPFVGRYVWYASCDAGTSQRISSSTCQAPIIGDVFPNCYIGVDGSTLTEKCDSGEEYRFDLHSPRCSDFFEQLGEGPEHGSVYVSMDRPYPGLTECRELIDNNCW